MGMPMAIAGKKETAFGTNQGTRTRAVLVYLRGLCMHHGRGHVVCLNGHYTAPNRQCVYVRLLYLQFLISQVTIHGRYLD